MYRKEWRIINRKPGSMLRQLYMNGFPTELFCFQGRVFKMSPIMGGQDPSWTISTGADDGYWRSSWDNPSYTWYGSASAVAVGRTATQEADEGDWAWLRWQNVSISGTITESYVQVVVYSGQLYGTPELKIWGIDEDNPAAPTNRADYKADPLTDTAVDWNPTSTGTIYTPSLNGIFQELVNTYTIQNDAVMLHLRNDKSGGVGENHYLYFRAYESGVPENYAVLNITYEEAARRIFIITT